MRAAALLLAFAASAAATPCHVSNVLGTHMVLQRDRPANVWGYADAGVSVTVSLNGAKLPAATADATGKWLTALPAQPATTAPSTLSFSCSDGTAPADITDVLFGDVHLCSGQSNMQFTLTSNAGVPNATAEIALANSYPHIRVFTVGEGTSSTTPLTELKTIAQNWSVASNTSIGGPGWAYMSAVCWFTFRDVYDALGGSVPQGLISTNWGGTPIQHWSSPDSLKTCNGGTDSTLWNAMVVPYVSGPMAVRTAVWYQGEANVGQASYYDCQFTAMIADWRKNLPGLGTFGFVQIAAYTGYSGFSGADLRQAQLAPIAALPKVAFATCNDLVVPFSAPGDIHPVAKQPVSQRLANQILTLEYGKDAPSQTPLYAGATAASNGALITVTVSLTGCVGGCAITAPYFVPPGVTAAQAAGFLIQTDDPAKTWWNASATPSADGSSLILSVEAPAAGFNAIASAYGRATWPITMAFNAIGLPVVPWCFTLSGLPCYNASDISTSGVISSGPEAARFMGS